MVPSLDVLSLIRRLFGSAWLPRRRAPVTCFIRENGPIAYELNLIGESPRDQARTLMETGLAWAWKSQTREWTALTAMSLSAFLGDLPGGALLIGAEGDLPTSLTDHHVKDWLRGFCRVDEVPLAVAIRLSPDRQLLFVQQRASASVTALLDALQLDRREAARSAYARLGSASLESIAQSLADLDGRAHRHEDP